MSEKPFIDFTGRQVIVTGASSGIGRAIAVELNRQGASVILTGRNRDELEQTAAQIGESGCLISPLDLSNPDDILPWVRDLAQKQGRIYGMCYSAGIVDTRPLSSVKVDRFRAMLDVNLIAGIELAKAVCRRDVMTEQEGSILFIASIYGWIGVPGEIGYSASKGATLAAARSMAVELARRKIRVNTLSPGLVRTPMTDKALSILTSQQVQQLEEAHPLGTGTPEDVARAAVFLMAPQNTWITGTDLILDGGYTAR